MKHLDSIYVKIIVNNKHFNKVSIDNDPFLSLESDPFFYSLLTPDHVTSPIKSMWIKE